jgi:hypothetical protein
MHIYFPDMATVDIYICTHICLYILIANWNQCTLFNCFFVEGGSVDWTQGFALAQQTLYHLNHSAGLFVRIVFETCLTSCPGHPGLCSSYLCFSAQLGWQVHDWDRFSQTFSQRTGLESQGIFLIPISQVNKITGLSHCAQPTF